MIDFIATTTMTDRSVVAPCLLGVSAARATGFAGVRVGNVRPTKASAAAAVAQASAYAASLAVVDAGAGRQKTQHPEMWAFRGPDPWRDPT